MYFSLSDTSTINLKIDQNYSKILQNRQYFRWRKNTELMRDDEEILLRRMGLLVLLPLAAKQLQQNDIPG
jgi:hypothetical protein